ncbi:IS66 family transposase, partial [Levilactobacillus enshiensis]|uniref:IS66 family transposase n=1 Tax=Levilactobacillus enshiensis TaxID=2590213 RepID=UPI0021F09D37
MQVLREPGKKATSRSYMWVVRSVQKSSIRAVLYAYGDTRSGTFAQNLYRGFTGVLQCDGYAGYNYLEDSVVRVGCFAHVRRKFYDAANNNGKVKMSRPLKLLNEMFRLEREWQHYSPRSRKRNRHRQLRKLIRKFWAWIDQANELPKSRLGKA